MDIAFWVLIALALVVVVYAIIQLAAHLVSPIPARVSQVIVVGVTLTYSDAYVTP